MMARGDRTKVDGKQTLEFDLLDEDLKKSVVDCINTRGRISVVIEDRGTVSAGDLTVAFKQLID
jgi:hypothetical protein